ncbi:MAG: hypothetical protein ACR2MN_13270 [Acidimicrobiales bacterium]
MSDIRSITDEPSLAEFGAWATEQHATGHALALDTETTGLIRVRRSRSELRGDWEGTVCVSGLVGAL